MKSWERASRKKVDEIDNSAALGVELKIIRLVSQKIHEVIGNGGVS